MDPNVRLLDNLEILYGEDIAPNIIHQIELIIKHYKDNFPELFDTKVELDSELNERDVILITYGDQFQVENDVPLETLHKFATTYLGDLISGLHILPFYPYSSDDGFSVIDYRQVYKELGDWENILELDQRYDLMFDAVINHVSSESEWFRKFIVGDSPYKNYFITVDPSADISQVVRPRAQPLLTPVNTNRGTRYVWTTFSDDQIDLNYANPQVLLEIIDLLIYYVIKGARFLRLDAIAYLWKQLGTPCIHLEETHAVIKTMRAALDLIAPWVIFISETNVPHAENVSYLGEEIADTGRTDEAQLIYNFSLAPLILHTFRIANTEQLSNWLYLNSNTHRYFNFIASHDGLGVIPAQGILSDNEIEALVEQTESHGGKISYKTNLDGSKSVYELNITLFDALNKPDATEKETGKRRFLASQAIMLVLAGVPGIYIHSFFGSHNCQSCVNQTGRARSINREKFDYSYIVSVLQDEYSRESMVFSGYRNMLNARRSHPAFHPRSSQKILDIHPAIFALLRESIESVDKVLCLTNVSDDEIRLHVELDTLNFKPVEYLKDLLNKNIYKADDNHLSIILSSYQSVWLTPNLV